MPIKEIVCDSCEASFTIEYEMLGISSLTSKLNVNEVEPPELLA